MYSNFSKLDPYFLQFTLSSVVAHFRQENTCICVLPNKKTPDKRSRPEPCIKQVFCIRTSWLFPTTDGPSCTVSIWDFKSARKWVTFRSVFHLFSRLAPCLLHTSVSTSAAIWRELFTSYSRLEHCSVWYCIEPFSTHPLYQASFLSHFQLLLVCPPHSQGNTAAVKLQLRFKHDLTDFMSKSKGDSNL